MHRKAIRVERREQSFSQLLFAGLRGCIFGDGQRIGNADKAIARANLQAGMQNLDVDLVELGQSAHLVKIAPLRLICDQVIAAHVVEGFAQPLAEIVIVMKEDAAGSLRQLFKAFLRVAIGCQPLRLVVVDAVPEASIPSRRRP